MLLVCGGILMWAGAELLRPLIAERDEAGREAARKYDRGTQAFAATGQVEPRAQEAKQALQEPEAEGLREAELVGKQRSKGDDSGGKR
jgi:hypothetical protein